MRRTLRYRLFNCSIYFEDKQVNMPISTVSEKQRTLENS